VVQTTDWDVSWLPPFGGFFGHVLLGEDQNSMGLWVCPGSTPHISHLAWERLVIPQEGLEIVAGERDVWVSLLGLLPPRSFLR